MFNMVITFEKCNFNPLLDILDPGDHNFFFTDTSPDKNISYAFLELCRQNLKRPPDIKISATRFSESKLFKIKDIQYIESFGNLKCINAGMESFEFYGTLYSIEKSIEKFGFVRIHNSYIISLGHIKKAKSRCVQMDDGKIINVGRKYITDYRAALKNMHNIKL